MTAEHITQAFLYHRLWMINVFALDNRQGQNGDHHTVPGIQEALTIMTSALTTSVINQVFMIGGILDAKHQLESQRIFQTLTAEAHKDYHVSEGLCEMGTMARSLAPSQRRAELGQVAFSQRMNERQLMSGDILSSEGKQSDFWSRLSQFVKVYCNPNDNAKGLNFLCTGGGTDKTRFNRDIDYTASVDSPLTLDIDFTSATGSAKTNDEENIFALSANLYAHETLPVVPHGELTVKDGVPGEGALKVLDVRALAAKRSVAQNSFAAIVSQRSKGSPEAAPFLLSALKQMSNEALTDEEIIKMLGPNPSYHAQMEMLTKKIYQHPAFFSDLYDKPANVVRKEAAMQAIGLMQKRDMYRSLLRSETLFSVILEDALVDAQAAVENEIRRVDQDGAVVPIE